MLDVKNEILVDTFISAREGGSNYWMHSMKPTSAYVAGDVDSFYNAMVDGFELVECYEDEVKHIVTKDDIKKGMELMKSKYPQHYSDMKKEYGDADTSDIFLQLCVFGKLIYG